jgi:flagellar hook-associated protein 3 FlgL
MRVTLGLQMDSTSGYLRTAAEKMLDAQRVVTTGKKISKPSDDPTLTNRSMSIRSGMNGIEQYQENTNLAKSVIDSSEATVGDIADQLQLLQQAAGQVNGALGEESKTAILAQIQDIRERLLGLADTKYLNRNIFSGTATNTSPIAANAANPAVPPYIYQGDPQGINIQIQPAEKIQTNVTANQIFNLDGSAGAGVKDVFTIMQDLETAVKAGDVTGASDLKKDIDSNHSNVLGLQAELGARSARLDDNATALSDSKDRMAELLSNLEDADLPSAIIALQTQQNVYQTALSVTAKLMQKTLADYL